MIKLSHGIILAIIAPLLIEAGFLAVVLNSLNDLEKSLTAEAKVADLMSLVSVVLNDTWMAGGSLLMYKVSQDQRFLKESGGFYDAMLEHTRQLQDLAKDMPEHNKAVEEFANIVNDIQTSSQNMVTMSEETYSVDQMRFASKFRSLTKRVNYVGRNLLTSNSVERRKLHEDQVKARAHLRQVIEVAAVTNILFALALAIVFALIFSKRWNVLMTNTINLGLGKPLLAPLGTGDEIGRLDGAMHALSQDLAVSREKERALIDKTAEVICSLDESARISEINPAVEKRFGYRQDALAGMNVQALIHPEDRDSVNAKLSEARKTKAETTFECRLKKKEERYAFTEWTVNWSSQDKSFFCVVLDVTARVEADNLKKEVIAMVSHDLRSPLTSIKLVLDCAASNVYGPLTEGGMRSVRGAQNSADYLITMISDLLDIETYEAGGLTLDYEPTDALHLIESAISTVAPEAQRHKVTITRDCPNLNIEADSERLRRTLVNLLNNAIKFSPAGGTISVSARLSDSGDSAEFRVRDQGPGIPEAKLETVFEKYKQVGTRSEGEKKGSGLGLAICRTLIEAHRGKIGVRSKPGEGSEFWFQIPTRN